MQNGADKCHATTRVSTAKTPAHTAATHENSSKPQTNRRRCAKTRRETTQAVAATQRCVAGTGRAVFRSPKRILNRFHHVLVVNYYKDVISMRQNPEKCGGKVRKWRRQTRTTVWVTSCLKSFETVSVPTAGVGTVLGMTGEPRLRAVCSCAHPPSPPHLSAPVHQISAEIAYGKGFNVRLQTAVHKQRPLLAHAFGVWKRAFGAGFSAAV